MSKTSSTHRGDIMRRIAALHAKIASAGRDSKPNQHSLAKREEMKRQIAELTEQMMAL